VVTSAENIRRGLVPGLKCGHDESRIHESWGKRTDGTPQWVRKCRECARIRSAKRYQEQRRVAATNGLR
jgi:hypothetical protein